VWRLAAAAAAAQVARCGRLRRMTARLLQQMHLQEAVLAASCALHDKLNVVLQQHRTWVEHHARWWAGSPSVTAPMPLAAPPVRRPAVEQRGC
jgi:hypothetical protein